MYSSMFRLTYIILDFFHHRIQIQKGNRQKRGSVPSGDTPQKPLQKKALLSSPSSSNTPKSSRKQLTFNQNISPAQRVSIDSTYLHLFF